MTKKKTRRKRRVGSGKRKGGAWERQTCKQLSLWLSGRKSETLFWRSAMSGGRATVMNKAGRVNQSQQGDISAVEPAGAPLIDAFVIECKSYQKLAIDRAVLQSSGLLKNFWRKLQKQAARCHKLPMLVAKQNQLEVILCLDDVGRRLLLEPGYNSLLRMKNPNLDLYIYFFKTLLNTGPLEVLKALRKHNARVDHD